MKAFSRPSRLRSTPRRLLVVLATGGVTAALLPAGLATAVPHTAAPEATPEAFRVFSPSFNEDAAAKTVTLPRYTGISRGQKVTYVITEASTRKAARRLGVNFSPRIGNARGTAAVQKVSRTSAGLAFPPTVDFRPVRRIVPGPTGFPPAVAEPGAIGEPGYSPLAELSDGTVINAPQVANATGRADKVVGIDTRAGTVTYRETDGFYEHRALHYVSFEASIPLAAALENATLAPALNAAPPDFPKGTPDPVPPAREEIGIVTNGQIGVHNPQRQGLSSAILDGLDPLNLLGEIPGSKGYSPLWDANLAQWTPAAVAAGLNTRQTDFRDLQRLAKKGLITAPDGGPFRRSDSVINCPAISIVRH